MLIEEILKLKEIKLLLQSHAASDYSLGYKPSSILLLNPDFFFFISYSFYSNFWALTFFFKANHW